VIDKITAIDKTTVRFDMKQPYFALPNILGMPYYLIFAREHFEGPEDRWKQQAIGTGPFMLTFSDPADRLDAVRKAFAATMADKDFIAEAEKQKLDVNPVTWQQMTEIIKNAFASPPELITRLRDAIDLENRN
jgi:ABC-type transport system substrate-binding protein